MERPFSGLARVEECAEFRPLRPADTSVVFSAEEGHLLFVESLGNEFPLDTETTVLLWSKDGEDPADCYEQERVANGIVLYLDGCDYYEVWQRDTLQECWSVRAIQDDQYNGCDCICETCSDCELRPENSDEQRTTWGDRVWVLLFMVWFLALPVAGLFALVRWLL